MRVEATRKVLSECDAALLVIDPEKGEGETEKALCALFDEKNISYIKVYSKSDIKKGAGLSVSSETGAKAYRNCLTRSQISSPKKKIRAV